MNPYHVLGVKKKATEEEIRAAYIALSKQYHPDVEGGDQEKFVEIKTAYEVLSDAARRSVFDETGTIPGDTANIIYNAAVNNLMQMFNDSTNAIPLENLETVDMPQMMRDATANIKRQTQSGISMLERQKAHCQKLREVTERKIKRKKKKKAAHLFLEAIDRRVQKIDSDILPMKQKIEVMDKALELLDEYQFEAGETLFLSNPIGSFILTRMG